MSSLDASEYRNAVEKLANNLTAKNSEVRERASESLLLKLELQIIPHDILLRDYHTLIGQCLIALNQSIEKKAPTTVSNLIKILRFFARTEPGKSLLKRYGTVEFMGEFLQFNKKAENSIAVEEIEAFLFTLVNKNVVALAQTAATSSLATTIPKSATVTNLPIEKTARNETYVGITNLKTLTNGLDNQARLDCQFGRQAKFKLCEEDRLFMVELTTLLKFAKKEEMVFDSPLFLGVCKVFDNFPMEILTGGFSETFYEIIKLLLGSKSKTLSAILFAKMTDWLTRELFQQKNFSNPKKVTKIEFEELEQRILSTESFLQDSYPSLLLRCDGHDELYSTSKKLTISNIFEIILRLLPNAVRHRETALFVCAKTKSIFAKIFEFSHDDQYLSTVELVCYNLLEFWENILATVGSVSELSLSNFEFVQAYSDLVIWLFSKLKSIGEMQPENGKKSIQMLKKSFNLATFSQWYVCGILKQTEVAKILSILREIDPNAATEFEAVVDLSSCKELFFSKFNTPQIDWGFNLDNEKNTVDVLGQATRILKIFEVIESDMGNFFDLFLICSFMRREANWSKREIPEKLNNSLQVYIDEFLSSLQRIFVLESCPKNVLFLLNYIHITLQNRPKRLSEFRKNFDLELELRLVLRESNILQIIILAVLENQTKDISNAPVMSLAIDILTVFFSGEAKIPNSIDFYLLCQFLSMSHSHSQAAKGLENFLTAKHPSIAKGVQLANIYSKDHLLAFNAFNSFVFDLKDDKSFTVESAKKMQLLGSTQDLKISKSHHYWGLVDDKNGSVSFKTNLKTLAGLANENAFVDGAKMQEVYDILELFLNQKLEQKIRQEALHQCIEAMLALRKNREARAFSATLANLAVDHITQEEPNAYTPLQVKSLVAFFCFQKYHPPLKSRLILRLRDWCAKTNFKGVERLLFAAAKSENLETKYNTFGLLQVVFFSSAVIEWKQVSEVNVESNTYSQNLRRGSSNLNLPKQNEDELLDFSESKFQPKIRFWKFNDDKFFNFFEGKTCLFRNFLDRQGFQPEVLVALKSNNGNFFNFLERLEAHTETTILETKKKLYGAASTLDLLPVCLSLASVSVLFQKHQKFIENYRNTSKIVDNLRILSESISAKLKSHIVSKGFDSLAAEIVLSSIFAVQKNIKKQTMSFLMTDFTVLILSQFQDISPLTIGVGVQIISLLANSVPNYSNLAKFNNEISDKLLGFLSQTIKTSESLILAPLISCLNSDNLSKLSNTLWTILSKCLTCFKTTSSFQDFGSKLQIFQLFLKLNAQQQKTNFAQIFEFYIRAKDAIRSPLTQIRVYGWLTLSGVMRHTNDHQFCQEMFYKCKDHVENLAYFDSPKVNILVYSLLGDLIGKHNFKEIQTDFGFIRPFGQKISQMSVLEIGGVLNLLSKITKFKKTAPMKSFDDSVSKIMEFVVQNKLDFVEIGRLHPGEKKQSIWKPIEDLSSSPNLFQSSKIIIFPKYFMACENLTSSDAHIMQKCLCEKDVLQTGNQEKVQKMQRLYLVFLDQLVEMLSLGNYNLAPISGKFLILLCYLNSSLTSIFTTEDSKKLVRILVLKIAKLIKFETMTESDLNYYILEISHFLETESQIPDVVVHRLLSSLNQALILLKNKSKSKNLAHLDTKDCPILPRVTKLAVQQALSLKGKTQNFQNLSFLLSLSNQAKFAFLTSDFLEQNKRELSRMVAEKNSKGLMSFYQLFKALFYPVKSVDPASDQFYEPRESTEPQSNNFSKIKENLRSIFFELSKAFAVQWEANDIDIPRQIFEILANWHINPKMCLFVEKQALKGKHFVLNSIFDTLKEPTRLNSPEFLNSLEFLRAISSCEFVAQQICKSRVFSGILGRIWQIYNTDKKGSQLASNLNGFLPVIDLFHALSFHRLTHNKMFENKALFEAFFFFLEKILKNFRVRKSEGLEKAFIGEKKENLVGNAPQTKTVCAEITKLEFSTLVFKILVFISNLLLTTSTKSLFAERDGFVDLVLDCLAYTNHPEDRLLVTQIFYNLIYKDGSVARLLRTQRFAIDFGDLGAELKSDLKKASNTVLREMTAEDRQREQSLKNLNSVQEIVKFRD
jgi:hypothetical protein